MNHPMYVVETYPDGRQRWVCKVCEHEFIMGWPPHFSKEVIHSGDIGVGHSGTTDKGLGLVDVSLGE